MIKAIDTKYKGYRFRSRLEARWAVFFDALGLKWEYEPEGFKLSNGMNYLPDFYLSDYNLWIEIKGKKPSIEELDKCLRLLSDLGGNIDNSELISLNKITDQMTNNPYMRFNSVRPNRQEFEDALFEMFCKIRKKTKVYLFEGFCENVFIILNNNIIRIPAIGVLKFMINESDKTFSAAIEKARSARFEHSETPH